jgi:hypothetical protein
MYYKYNLVHKKKYFGIFKSIFVLFEKNLLNLFFLSFLIILVGYEFDIIIFLGLLFYGVI